MFSVFKADTGTHFKRIKNNAIRRKGVSRVKLISGSITLFVLLSLSACFHRMVPPGNTGRYDKQQDITVYTVTPYGSLSLPGKWESGKYNKTSLTQYFYRADTTTMTTALGPCGYFPFGRQGAEGYNFVKRYYDMEARYQAEFLEQTPEIIATDSTSRYMIWKVRSDGVDEFHLCGVKDCNCDQCAFALLMVKNRRLNRETCVKMLKDIFLSAK